MSQQQALRRALAPSSAGWVRRIVFATGIALFATPMPANAALSCMAQTGAVAFGTYNPAAAGNDDSTGYVEVKCTCSALDCVAFGYSIEIDSGASGSVSDRRMRKTGQSSGGLKYSLYRDLPRTLPWDMGSNKLSLTYLLSAFGTYQRTTVYGRMPAAQVVATGDYSDTPGVTINY